MRSTSFLTFCFVAWHRLLSRESRRSAEAERTDLCLSLASPGCTPVMIPCNYKACFIHQFVMVLEAEYVGCTSVFCMLLYP